MPENHRFQRLGRLYILALSGIAAAIIISQIVVQNFISRQQNDSRIINVAGRQRMLSQNMAKLALLIRDSKNQTDFEKYQANMKESLELWTSSHRQLTGEDPVIIKPQDNSRTIRKMFTELEASYKTIEENTTALISMPYQIDSISGVNSNADKHIQAILNNEDEFLTKMNEIVFQFDDEAKHKVSLLKQVEFVLLFISLCIIILEIVFVFRPLALNVRRTISNLIKSEEASKKMTQEISKVYNELGKSYQDLEAVNLEPDQPLIFLKCNNVGKITYVSDKFLQLMETNARDFEENFISFLEKNEYDADFIKNLMRVVTAGKTWNGELKLTTISGDFIWLDTSLVSVTSPRDHKQEWMMIARDMSEIKEAKLKSREINREMVEKRVKEQEYRSVLILEGQEEERKRISREIHDGIGQMLTAMKLNLEAITPSSSVHSRKRFDDTRSLLKNVIKEVRRVSFNLTPSSLSDFGIVPALRKFCQEVEKLSDLNIIFENESGFINRLDSNVETNLYRIIQEAVNNAVKYSKAKTITISLVHDSQNLEINIQDDGKGFDYETLEQKGHFGVSGHGIFNMKERTAFINGKFKLKTKPGQGTSIKITLPLN